MGYFKAAVVETDTEESAPREPTRLEYQAALENSPPVLRLVFDGEFEIASRALSGERSPQALAQLFLGTAARVEDAVAKFDLPVACGAGCSWCCRGTKVEVLAPEALAIAEVLRHSVADQAGELQAELSLRADKVRGLGIAERWRQQIPCAFLDLDTGHCSIHPVRPLACRQHHSVDASECERAAADASGEQRTHGRLLLESIWGAARAAVRYACTDVGLDERGFELTNAVVLAMKEPDARERWARGERLFDAATIPSDAEDRQLAAREVLQSRSLISPDQLLRKPSKSERNKQKRARKERKSTT